ncbi:MAG: four helix bundle protein [Chitinophagales bacterium]
MKNSSSITSSNKKMSAFMEFYNNWTLINMNVSNIKIQKKFDLEDRLVKFAGEIIFYIRTVKKDYEGQYLCEQIIRSASSAALNFGEAQASESPKDFRHKCKIAVKELKESRVNLKLMQYIDYGDASKRNKLLDECEQLIAIISTIIKNSNK